MNSVRALRLAAGWLILTGAGHVTGHVSSFVTRRGLSPERLQAYEIMRGTGEEGILNASFWTVTQMFSWQMTLFLLFAILTTWYIAGTRDAKLIHGYARLATGVFGLGVFSFVVLYPQIHAAVIAVGSTLFFGLAWAGARR